LGASQPDQRGGLFISKPFTDYTLENYLAITAANLTRTKMMPAPKKSIPVTIWAAIREGSSTTPRR
jgi:hypothetical protein